jgi:hypothetical protein
VWLASLSTVGVGVPGCIAADKRGRITSAALGLHSRSSAHDLLPRGKPHPRAKRRWVDSAFLACREQLASVHVEIGR